MTVFFCMTITEPKTTPMKKVINSKSSLSCPLCEVSVVASVVITACAQITPKNWTFVLEFLCYSEWKRIFRAACSVQEVLSAH